MGSKVDLDRVTERAWDLLERDLERRIEILDEGELIRLELDASEREDVPGVPFIQVLWRDGELVIETPRNRLVADRFRLTKPSRVQLVTVGWERLGGQSHYRRAVDDATITAGVAVWTLRTVWGVPHPAFLIDADDLVPDEDRPLRTAGPRPEWTLESVTPRSNDHLRELVDGTLSADVGEELNYDSDGDIPFRAGDSVVFVRVSSGDSLWLFAELVLDVEDHRMAEHEVRVLNRDIPHLKFVLVGDTIRMRGDIQTDPFAPAHLRQMVDLATEVAAKQAPDVAFRVGGRCFLDFSAHAESDE